MQGPRSLALADSVLAADDLGRTLTVDALTSGAAIPYQDAIVAGSTA